MTTLNDILLAVCRDCLQVHKGASTDTGTTATLIDTTFTQANDQFNNGVLFFRTGTYADQFKAITDYASSTGTWTFTPVVAGNVPSGVLYEAIALMSGANLYDIIGAVNQALFELGDIPTIIDYADDATLVTVADQEEYSLPTGVRGIRKMWVGTQTSSPYNYRPFTHYQEINGTLYIPYKYTAYLGDGFPLRYQYFAEHATLDSYEDTVSSDINKQWLVYATIVNLLRNLGVRGGWGEVKVTYEEAQQKVITMRPLINSINVSIRTD